VKWDTPEEKGQSISIDPAKDKDNGENIVREENHRYKWQQLLQKKCYSECGT